MVTLMSNDDDQVGDLITRISGYVFERRVRIKTFFKTFDEQHGHGFVTKPQFARALTTATQKGGSVVSDSEAAVLADHFTDNTRNPPAVVNYIAFCAAVDEIFAPDDMRVGPPETRSPMMMSGSPNSTLRSTLTKFQPKPVEDEERVMHVLHRVATLCKTKGIVFKYLYYDNDRNPNPSPARSNPTRGGKVNVNQFKRNFPFHKEIKEEDLDLLIERYKTAGGDVHFQAIHNDVSEVLNPEGTECPKSELHLKADNTEWAHMSLNPVRKVQSKVVEKRVRLKDFFADFDPLRRGVVTAGQLKTALTCSGLDKDISKEDFSAICNSYRRDDGMFSYRAFIKDIDSAFGPIGLEKDPLAMTTMTDASTTLPARRNKIQLGSRVTDKILQLEDKLRTRVMAERIDLKPIFLDMDKAHSGLVSRNQFARCMGILGWKNLTEEHFDLLAAAYCDRGNHNDFNYVDFIKAVDPPDAEQAEAMRQLNSPFMDEAPSKYFEDGRRVVPLRQSPLLR